jgi:GT2 family glycosyltransferase
VLNDRAPPLADRISALVTAFASGTVVARQMVRKGTGTLPKALTDRTVSVVIPVFNRQRLGERAVLSACAQGLNGMEVVVVDDGSDPPFRMPAAMPPDANARLIRHEVNSGAGAARNSGISAARGEWIALLDSDDYWLPATLEPRLDFARRVFASSESAAIAFAAGFIVKKGGRMDDVRMPREASSPQEFVCGCWFSPGSTSLFRKEIFERVGPWDPKLRRLEDYDWFLRFALAGGRLQVWNTVAAVIELEGKPSMDVLDATARHLLWKYASAASQHLLPRSSVRRLRAMLDVERASICRYQGQWLGTIFYLVRSFARVPRVTIHLRHFWRQEARSRAASRHR